MYSIRLQSLDMVHLSELHFHNFTQRCKIRITIFDCFKSAVPPVRHVSCANADDIREPNVGVFVHLRAAV